MTDHKKRAAQNNLHGSIYDHLIEAWTMAKPRPPMGHSFGRGFTSYEPDVQQYLHDFVFRVIQGLLEDGCLQQPTHDDEGKAVQAVNTLHGLTGDINETTAWINRAARLAAADVDAATLDVLGRISSTQPVTPDDLNKLAQGGIPTPSLDESDEWERCEFEDVNMSDQAVLFAFNDGTKLQGIPHQYGWDTLDLWIGNVIRTITGGDVERSEPEIYRIPAPVVHPDPAEHPVVISNTGVAWVWDGDKYIEVLGGGHRGPGDFGPGWTPGKVIADE